MLRAKSKLSKRNREMKICPKFPKQLKCTMNQQRKLRLMKLWTIRNPHSTSGAAEVVQDAKNSQAAVPTESVVNAADEVAIVAANSWCTRQGPRKLMMVMSSPDIRERLRKTLALL